MAHQPQQAQSVEANQPLPVAEKKATEKKNVSWASSCLKKRHVHVSDYTDEELKAFFFNRRELKKFKEENVRIVDAVRNGFGEDEESRGLEYRLFTGKDSARYIRRIACQAVLKEQHLQFKNNFRNAQTISSLYQVFANKCKADAYMLALEDEAMASGRESHNNTAIKQEPANPPRRQRKVFSSAA